ncbi:MAG: slipin family protein [Bacillota bacterium]|nr:slipin family protein [Bacillota bacterium]
MAGLGWFSLAIFAVMSLWWLGWIGLAIGTRQSGTAAILAVLGVIWIGVAWWLQSAPLLFPLFILWSVAAGTVLASMVRIITEYERGVLFRLGRLMGVLGPGLNVVLPVGIDRVVKLDTRTITVDVSKQEIITRDNVPVLVDAVVYFNIFDPVLAVTKVVSYYNSTTLLGQTILRSVLGQHELDDMLAKRAELNDLLRKLLDEATDPWGIKVTGVEIKAVELPETMKRAMAKQAEAERERRAKVIAADGEFQASQKLTEAAKVIATEPAALQLRYLQTLTEISVEKNSTIVLIPVDTPPLLGRKA